MGEGEGEGEGEGTAFQSSTDSSGEKRGACGRAYVMRPGLKVRV
jgi:hypothetical protein